MALASLLVLCSVVFVAIDASGRDWSEDKFANASWKWVIGVLLLWFIALPVYMIHRRRYPKTTTLVPAEAFTAPERPAGATQSVPPPGHRR